MRKSQLVSLELFSPLYPGDFATEPYEAGWASQALCFVYVDEVHGEASLEMRVQVAADGQRWIDFGCEFPVITQPGGYFVRISGFGSWLRLAGHVTKGPDDGTEAMTAHIYLDLKE